MLLYQDLSEFILLDIFTVFKTNIISEIIKHRCHLDEHRENIMFNLIIFLNLLDYISQDQNIFGPPNNYRIIGTFNEFISSDSDYIICKLKYHNTIVAVKSELVILECNYLWTI